MIQFAGALAVEDHVERRAVLHGAARIEIFRLPEDLDAREIRAGFYPDGSVAYCRLSRAAARLPCVPTAEWGRLAP